MTLEVNLTLDNGKKIGCKIGDKEIELLGLKKATQKAVDAIEMHMTGISAVQAVEDVEAYCGGRAYHPAL